MHYPGDRTRNPLGISQEAALSPISEGADIQFLSGLASLHAKKLALTSQLSVCPHYKMQMDKWTER